MRGCGELLGVRNKRAAVVNNNLTIHGPEGSRISLRLLHHDYRVSGEIPTVSSPIATPTDIHEGRDLHNNTRDSQNNTKGAAICHRSPADDPAQCNNRTRLHMADDRTRHSPGAGNDEKLGQIDQGRKTAAE